MDRSISMFIVLAIFAIGQNEVYAIIQGTRAEDGEFPYMVQIIDRRVSYICGGTILSPEWILTRGLCNGDLFVAVGSNELYNYNASYIQTYNVKNFIRHPKFDLTEFDDFTFRLIYDVGLIQVDRPIVFTDKIQPIKLPDTEDVPFHVSGTIAGWGPSIRIPIRDTEYLLKHDVKISTDEECEDISVWVESFDPNHHLCTIEDNNRVCSVDRGGPLVINGTQYAIMSWDFDFCGGGKATAYTRITNPEYRAWIKNVTGI